MQERSLAVVGTGYVGLVTGTCFAEKGYSVICCDIDEVKIARLKQNDIPIYEPGLEELVRRNVEEGRLKFTTSLQETVQSSETLFLAVGTPMSPNGEADLSYVEEAIRSICLYLDSPKLIVMKSTVPVGTCRRMQALIDEQLSFTDKNAFVISNPEFLREGTALHDCMNMERVVIGADNEEAGTRIVELYESFATRHIRTDWESAEMIKYASNVFLAMKISFINEVANLCEMTGASVVHVADGVGADSRIGRAFLNAGIGYGGSCFPKDTEALLFLSQQHGYDFRLLRETIAVNQLQRNTVIRKLEKALGTLQDMTIAVLGLTFKPGTDDMRQSPSLVIVPELLRKGARIKAFDPLTSESTQRLLGSDVEYVDQPLEACFQADACLVLTEWEENVNNDWVKASSIMRSKIIVDGRNCLSAEHLADLGFHYYGVGQIPLIPEPIMA